MSHAPFEYWWGGSILLTLATTWLASIPFPELSGTIGAVSFVFWLVLWAYSPLPQGPNAPNHKERKRKWGFKVEHE